jgi:hypothetical protein
MTTRPPVEAPPLSPGPTLVAPFGLRGGGPPFSSAQILYSQHEGVKR